MNYLKTYIYGLIKSELKRVEEEKKAPVVATHRAIMDQLISDANEAINCLKADGLVNESISLNRMPLYSLTTAK